MSTDVPGRLNVNWDAYWKGFMTIPALDALRSWLIRGGYLKLLKGVAFPARPHFCELGAGSGQASRFLGDRWGADVSLIDSNSRALEISRKTFAGFSGSVNVIARDVFDLNDFCGHFDLVHSGGLIEHFLGETRQRIVSEHCALVKEGGYVLILVPVANIWYKILVYGIFTPLGLMKEIPEEPWSAAELRGALAENGFEIIRSTIVICELGVLARRKVVGEVS